MKIHSLGNSGLCLCGRDRTLLIDGVHSGEKVAFSPMPAAVRRDLWTHSGLFSNLTGILFTHDHPDHCDRALLRTCPRLPPVHGPGFGDADVQPFLPGIIRIVLEGCAVWALDTVHDGPSFSEVPHQSYLVALDGVRVFVAGDAILGETEGARLRALGGGRADAALLNPYQILDPRGWDFLREAKPDQVFLYHLPFPGSDPLGCYALAAQAEARYPADLPPLRRLIPPMEVELLPPGSPETGGFYHEL